MKTLTYIYIILATLFCCSCEKVEIEDVPTFDNTDIISFKAYDTNKANILIGDPAINNETKTVTAIVKKDVDLSHIFTNCGISSGANIAPALGRYEDWSSKTKTFILTSASGKRSQQWTIILKDQ